MAINIGDQIDATTASGETVRLRAISEPMDGRDFPVVWVCTEEAWDEAQRTGADPDGLPWPLDAVQERTAA